MLVQTEQNIGEQPVPKKICEQVNAEQDCPYCQYKVELIWVHGHYQCPNCKHVVVSCCGDS